MQKPNEELQSWIVEIAGEGYRLFFYLAIAFAVFAWVARSILYHDPAVARFGELSLGAFAWAGGCGCVLLGIDVLGWWLDRR